MAGHSKWANIRRHKGAVDAKRAILFTKLIKEITVAARMGGGDPLSNPRLRQAIDAAKSNSMPKENIERAINKGTGNLEGVTYEEIIYEGYGPGGVAVIVESLTDNKVRTVAGIRNIFSKRGGNLGESGCVSWMFHKKGTFQIAKDAISEEELMELALKVGADDTIDSGDTWEMHTPTEIFSDVKEALDAKNVPCQTAEIALLPENTVTLNEEDATKVLKLLDALEEYEDVQKVSSNYDISDEIMENISS